jgi:molybdopterin converting factor subunit 1
VKVSVRLFAFARELAGCETLELQLPEAATVRDVRRALVDACPALERLAGRLLIAIDAEYAGDDQTVPAGAELACIPPVSGG